MSSNNNKEKSSLIKDAKEITSSLSKSYQTLNSTVSRADDVTRFLIRDGYTLQDTLNEHKNIIKDNLSKTKSELNQIKTAEMKEKRNLFFALLFFTGVVMYIILKRTRILLILYYTINSFIHTGRFVSDTITVNWGASNRSSKGHNSDYHPADIITTSHHIIDAPDELIHIHRDIYSLTGISIDNILTITVNICILIFLPMFLPLTC